MIIGLRSSISPTSECAATPEPNSPYPVIPSSVRMAEKSQGRRPPSTTKISTSVIFIGFAPCGLVITYPRLDAVSGNKGDSKSVYCP